MALAAFIPTALPTARVAVPTSPAEIAFATVDADLESALHRLYMGSHSPFAGWVSSDFDSMIARTNYSALREILCIALAAQHGCPDAQRDMRSRI